MQSRCSDEIVLRVSAADEQETSVATPIRGQFLENRSQSVKPRRCWQRMQEGWMRGAGQK